MMMMFTSVASKRTSRLLNPVTQQLLAPRSQIQSLSNRKLSLIDTPQRHFFGSKKYGSEQKPKEEEKATSDEAATEETKAEASKETSEDKAAAESEDTADESAKEGAEADDGLSAKDVKRIKQLFSEQESEIKALEKQIKKLEGENEKHKADGERKEKETFVARIEFTKQVKENEQTVLRYRKMIEDEKEFAISKFAKDLLEVRDAVRLAIEHTDVEAVIADEDIQSVKDKFVATMEGQQMTANVMDKCLERFKVVQYDPKGKKFDPTLHEAVFTVPVSEQANDTVEIVISTGFKIGDRVLRAAKVGIVKK